MAPSIQKRPEYVDELARKNRAFYGTTDGRGTLRSLELIFEYRWIYIFELIQNALDASAKSIFLPESPRAATRWCSNMTGRAGFDEPEVEGALQGIPIDEECVYRGLHGESGSRASS